jgi:hypothetical protein
LVARYMQSVTDWLLDPSDPAVRYLAMRDLLDGTSTQDLREARSAIASRGWVADILSNQKPGGYWEDRENLYRPKYISTNWMLLTLSDLGVTRDDPRIAEACSLWMDRFSRPDGGFDTGNTKKSEHCLTGNTARALIKFGYVEEPRVKTAFDYFVKTQFKNGGWHCWGSSGTIDSWEGMSAFAVYPRQKWTRAMSNSVERGAEFYLARELCNQGAHYEPWFRFHFPYHYYYDILVGLDFMTALGYTNDKRLGLALSHLKKKQRKDGKWNLDAVHPDYDNLGKLPRWWEEYKDRFHPFALEKVGRPSKMITLRALIVLKRLGEFDPR